MRAVWESKGKIENVLMTGADIAKSEKSFGKLILHTPVRIDYETDWRTDAHIRIYHNSIQSVHAAYYCPVKKKEISPKVLR